MTHAADPWLQQAAAHTWSERNQSWLSRRLGFWCERLAHRADGGGAEPDALPGPEASADFESAAEHLAALFGLSVFEREMLVLAAGVEIDVALRDAVARVQGIEPGQPVRLSFSLALALLPQPHWDALSPLRPLRHWALVDVDTRNGFTLASIRIDEPVLHHLTGVAACDERLSGLAQFDEAAPDPAAAALAERIARAMGQVRAPLVLLADAARDAARRRAGRALTRAVFAQVGLRTLWVDLGALADEARETAALARRIDRQAALAGAGVGLAFDAEAPHAAAGMRLIAALRCPLVLLGAPSAMQLADCPARQALRFGVPAPQAMAPAELAPRVQRAAERALQQFRVEPALLEQALAALEDVDDEAGLEAALWERLREAARGGLDALAQRSGSGASFDDLVLPALAMSQLRELAVHLRHRQRVYEDWGFGERQSRGLGIAALFAGESGTGKTLAAEAIANHARLDLYQIDLSSVVSKYIGETEKNLARLFDAAERSGAVLLFDEADALFGKRSEVKDSHDRYANIEVAYLLQRIEAYRGLAILTTNLKSALDRAFLRRIRFVVQFPFPDEAAREQIWRRQFPARAPLGAVDFGALARLQLSGGHIRAVALNAAFHAAGRDEPIGQAALVAAARAECAKLERPMSEALARTVG